MGVALSRPVIAAPMLTAAPAAAAPIHAASLQQEIQDHRDPDVLLTSQQHARGKSARDVPDAPERARTPCGEAEALAAARAELDASTARRFQDEYTLGRIIGHGAYACVHECTHIESGQRYAVKVLSRSPATGGSGGGSGGGERDSVAYAERDDVVREVAVMKALAGHPAAVQLVAAYESNTTWHIIMELCSGGELFEHIIAAHAATTTTAPAASKHSSSSSSSCSKSSGGFSEGDAAAVIRALLSFLQHAHACGVVHRDIKPENILLAGEWQAGCNCMIKVIDYGTSMFCTPGQRLTDKRGTPAYVAPEVLAGSYEGQPADVWSAGVVLYTLLCGRPPFPGRDEATILARVRAGRVSFAQREWEGVTEEAKGVISDMLWRDPCGRATAAQLLARHWVGRGPAAGAATAAATAAAQLSALALQPPQLPLAGAATAATATNTAAAASLGVHVVRRLRMYSTQSRIKRLALVVYARTLGDTDVAQLRDLFMTMDKDGDGTISSTDLYTALTQVGAVLDAAELAELFKLSDLSGRGLIQYEQFTGAMLDCARVAARGGALRRSFERLDRDGDGYISVQDLVMVLEEEQRAALPGQPATLTQPALEAARHMLEEVHAAPCGGVGFQDFVRLWTAAPAAAALPLRAVAAASPPHAPAVA